MVDPRIPELASQLVNYSTRVKAGDHVLIDCYDVPAEVPISLIRAVRAAGGFPHVQLHDAKVSRALNLESEEERLDQVAGHLLSQMEAMQAYIAVRGSEN
ncbi:MAG: aminopeptidase, partial [Verrucomicrobiota bacterium]